MRKIDAIAALCRIVTLVGREVFKDRLARDCFCHESNFHDSRVTVESDIISFIDRAVREKIDRENASAQTTAYSNSAVAAYRAELEKTRARLKEQEDWTAYWFKSSVYWREACGIEVADKGE